MPKEKVYRIDQGVVDAIRHVLDDAEKGLVRSVAIATVGHSYNSGFAWSFGATGDATKLVGAIEVLKTRVLLDFLDVDCYEGEADPPDGANSA